MRVKVLFAKKDNALIQMAEPQQAHLALSHLDKMRVMGRTIHVTLSKHVSVQLPKEGQPDSGLTRDFSNSTLHRFKKPGSKNYCNIFPPSTTLHLSNIPHNVSEQEIRDLFSAATPSGGPSAITGFKFFPKDRKMALISLATLDDAILCLLVRSSLCLFFTNQHVFSFVVVACVTEVTQSPVGRVFSPEGLVLQVLHLNTGEQVTCDRTLRHSDDDCMNEPPTKQQQRQRKQQPKTTNIED